MDDADTDVRKDLEKLWVEDEFHGGSVLFKTLTLTPTTSGLMPSWNIFGTSN